VKTKVSHPDIFEVVFVSSDRDEGQWASYFAEMPWLALPFNDRGRKDTIASKFGISGIPTLVLLDAETGETINANARMDVVQHPDGKGFPWKK
jgi:nucleoredoxin